MNMPLQDGTPPTCVVCGAQAGRDAQACPVCGAPLAEAAPSDAVDGPQPTHDPAPEPAGTAGSGTVLEPWAPTPPAPTPPALAPPVAPALPSGTDEGAGPHDGGPAAPPRFAALRAAYNRRWVRRSVAVVTLLAVLSPLVADDLGTRSRLDATRRRLHATDVRLTRTRADLDGTRRELASVRTELGTRTRERDDLRARLDATSAELAGVRGSLSEAQSRLNLQAGQIATLKSCLSGVAQALVYVADGYYGLAASALEAVRVACQEASALF